MEGVDIHVDVNVGKQLSALGHTLTMLTGTEQDDDTATIESDSDETDHTDGQRPSETLNRVVCSFLYFLEICCYQQSSCLTYVYFVFTLISGEC